MEKKYSIKKRKSAKMELINKSKLIYKISLKWNKNKIKRERAHYISIEILT